MEIVDPRGRIAAGAGEGLATRLEKIPTNMRIGFLINERSRSQGPDFHAYTVAIEEALRSRCDSFEVVRSCRPLLSRPAEPELLEGFADVAGVVNGLAK